MDNIALQNLQFSVILYYKREINAPTPDILVIRGKVHLWLEQIFRYTAVGLHYLFAHFIYYYCLGGKYKTWTPCLDCVHGPSPWAAFFQISILQLISCSWIYQRLLTLQVTGHDVKRDFCCNDTKENWFTIFFLTSCLVANKSIKMKFFNNKIYWEVS